MKNKMAETMIISTLATFGGGAGGYALATGNGWALLACGVLLIVDWAIIGWWSE